jgi:hypothetical protein
MRKGSALVLIVVVIALLAVLGGLWAKAIYGYRATATLTWQGTKAFYLAEAGLAKGQNLLALSPDWYTDLPHSPPDDSDWLIKSAIGQTDPLGFKLVREKGKPWFYSIGLAGDSRTVLKLAGSTWSHI